MRKFNLVFLTILITGCLLYSKAPAHANELDHGKLFSLMQPAKRTSFYITYPGPSISNICGVAIVGVQDKGKQLAAALLVYGAEKMETDFSKPIPYAINYRFNAEGKYAAIITVETKSGKSLKHVIQSIVKKASPTQPVAVIALSCADTRGAAGK